MKYERIFKTLCAMRKSVISNCRSFAAEAGMSVNTVRKIEKGTLPPCSV